MSGKPSESGVKEMRLALKELSEASRSIVELQRSIREAGDQLDQKNSDYRVAREKVFKLMEGMDVLRSGNAGWERRMEVFLVEMHRQGEFERAGDL